MVQEALENIISTQQRTTVIIAHRLSTIRNADIIAVVMGGAIAEAGTHAELMAKDSYYKKLVDSQGKMTIQQAPSVISKSGSAMSLGAGTSDVLEVGDAVGVDRSVAPLIAFKRISFSYPSRPNKLILDNFKLKIFKGETVALVGTSGGGKSTVMAMIERFYDPSEGTVEYLGEDISKLNVKWYRDQIGYVPNTTLCCLIALYSFELTCLPSSTDMSVKNLCCSKTRLQTT